MRHNKTMRSVPPKPKDKQLDTVTKLLDRCGIYLDSIHLYIGQSIELLERCPNLSHVKLSGAVLEKGMVDHLRTKRALKWVKLK